MANVLEGVEFHDLAAKPLLYILERVENRADEITDDDDYDDAEPELGVLLCVCSRKGLQRAVQHFNYEPGDQLYLGGDAQQTQCEI